MKRKIVLNCVGRYYDFVHYQITEQVGIPREPSDPLLFKASNGVVFKCFNCPEFRERDDAGPVLFVRGDDPARDDRRIVIPIDLEHTVLEAVAEFNGDLAGKGITDF